MRISGDWLRRLLAGCLMLLLAVPFGEAATVRVQPPLPGGQAQGAAPSPAHAASPGSDAAAGSAKSAPLPNNPGATSQPPAQPPSGSQGQSQQQQNSTSNPVGTAAAPYVKPMGIPASRPAGAAIAPAKQKRARSFLIKVGIIVGAAIAIGAVVGLSKASPSRPN